MSDRPSGEFPAFLLAEAVVVGSIGRVFTNFQTDPTWLLIVLVMLAILTQGLVLFWTPIKEWLGSAGWLRLTTQLPLAAIFFGAITLWNAWEIAKISSASEQDKAKQEIELSQAKRLDNLKSANSKPPSIPSSVAPEKKPSEDPDISSLLDPEPPSTMSPPTTNPAIPSGSSRPVPKPPERVFTRQTTAYLRSLCKDATPDQCKTSTSPWLGKWVHVSAFVWMLPRFFERLGFSVVAVDKKDQDRLLPTDTLFFAEKYREYVGDLKEGSTLRALCRIEEVDATNAILKDCDPEN